MGVKFDLEKRARELLPDFAARLMVTERQAAMRLAREYADAQAENIARRIDLVNVHSAAGRTTEELCASVARSFISNQAPDLSMPTKEQCLSGAEPAWNEAAIRAAEPWIAGNLSALARVGRLAGKAGMNASEVCLRTLERLEFEQIKPKTREQVLEEALRFAQRNSPCTCARPELAAEKHSEFCIKYIASRALEARQ